MESGSRKVESRWRDLIVIVNSTGAKNRTGKNPTRTRKKTTESGLTSSPGGLILSLQSPGFSPSFKSSKGVPGGGLAKVARRCPLIFSNSSERFLSQYSGVASSPFAWRVSLSIFSRSIFRAEVSDLEVLEVLGWGVWGNTAALPEIRN